MPCMTLSGINSRGGYGDPIRVYWKNKKADNATTILTGTNYLKLGYALCWAPMLTDDAGVKGMVATRPETLLLGCFAGLVYSMPTATFGSSGSPAGQQEGWIEVLPYLAGAYVSAWTNVDLSSGQPVYLGLADGNFGLVAAVALSADAAGQGKARQCVGVSLEAGANTSVTPGYNNVLLTPGVGF